MTWKTIDRPGYFGNKREEIQAGFDSTYGKNKWRIAWEVGKLTLQRPEALQFYEDGYYEHLKANPKLRNWLESNFLDVYDTAPSNIESVFSYDIQETPNNHIHDVAIRRALLRNGVYFSGKKLLEVRSVNAEGWVLSPSNIPFHLPDLIFKGQTKYHGEERDFVKNPPWWIKLGVKGSVEEFYQQNKILQISCQLDKI